MTITRQELIGAIRSAVEPMRSVIAMWEGGSAALGRADVWSDLDVHLLVDDDSVAAVLAAVDAALPQLSPIEIRYELPKPAWHGMDQVFYRLRDAGEYLFIDLAVMQRSATERFDERERHGRRAIIFDKTGEAADVALDRAKHAERMATRLAQLRQTFPLFQCLVKKEVLRGNLLGALSFYHAFTLQPLMTALRMVHCPDRFDFGARYAAVDLPAETVAQLESLWLVSSLDDLAAKRERAERMFTTAVRAIERT
jgi:hypothetical protein